jgi:putative transposase
MSTSRDPLYRRHRFPPEVISYAVWLYFRFPMSLRIVEEMLAARGICGTNETVREWGRSRQGVLRSDPPARACSRRQMAYGWGGSSRLLASRTGCARRRSKWLRSRRLGPASKRQSRCAAAHEEPLEIRRHTAARHDYGQAPFIRRCEGARWAFASNIASTRA